MANVNLSTAFEKVIFERFGGIERQRTAKGGASLTDLRNLRVTDNGALTKRGGFAPMIELPEGRIRAIHAVSKDLVFALIENELYELYPSEHSYEQIATLTESDSDACFFNYGNELYLSDGKELYVYSGEGFEIAEGYVPLYGKNWHPLNRGDVYQPLNALSSRLRVSYKLISATTPTFILPFMASSIDKVLRNGASISLADFSFGALANMVSNAKTFAVGDEIEIFFTINASTTAANRAAILEHTGVSTFGFATNSGDPSFLAFFGGANPAEICISRHFSALDMSNAAKGYSRLHPIYVVRDDIITINDGSGEITAACRCGSDLAVFTPHSTYVFSESEGDRSKLAQISETLGCSVKNGAVTLESSPVTLFGERVLYWSVNDLNDNKYSAEVISEPISELLPYINRWSLAAYHPQRGELWFSGTGSRVWIYNVRGKLWYSFDGFYPDMLFEMGDDMAFISGSVLYAFSDRLFYDETDEDFYPITATIESDMISFGAPNRKKRLARVMLSFSSDGALYLTTTDAESSETDTEIHPTGVERREYCERRLRTKRSRHYSFRINHDDGPFTLYALTLTAVK